MPDTAAQLSNTASNTCVVWVETMRNLASRTGMRELALRSPLHGAVFGDEGDGAAAVMLAAEIELSP